MSERTEKLNCRVILGIRLKKKKKIFAFDQFTDTLGTIVEESVDFLSEL